MMNALSLVAVTVLDYDEAIAFWVGRCGFALVEDTDLGDGKRWVRVRPPGAPPSGAELLLARATTDAQRASVGNQTGGRVFLFFQTDDFWRDYRRLVAAGVTVVREPRDESYGTVAVFADLYGNRFDLLGRR
jgi:catechol 2,3-dioxygenase-like lactoylglutathione lyase family enzyme